MSIGLTKKNKIFYSKAVGINKPVIYVGSKTGRDGIHGASMASAKFDNKAEEKKPTLVFQENKIPNENCVNMVKTNREKIFIKPSPEEFKAHSDFLKKSFKKNLF